MTSWDPREWDYREIVRPLVAAADRVLDLGTGDGEVLASLAPFRRVCVATETWPPNVPVAARRLGPIGVGVVWATAAPDNTVTVAGDPPALPFRDGAFDLVIDRHESFVPSEVRRILRRGGRFVTQQVGARDLLALNEAIGAPFPYSGWHLVTCCGQLERAGLRVVDQREGFSDVVFPDVDSIVTYLERTPWHAPGWTQPRSSRALDRLARRLPLRARAHRFFVVAVRP